MAALAPEQDGAAALTREQDRAPALTREQDRAPALTREQDGAAALTREQDGAAALTREQDRAPALTRERDGAAALTREQDRAPALTREQDRAAALTREQDRAPAPTREVKSALASALTRQLEPARSQGGGGEDGPSVLYLVRMRDRLKDHLLEYNTAVHGSQENFPDDVIEESCIQSAIEDLQREIDEAKVSFQNKTLALQRIQITAALRNKMYQDDEEARLILETVKHIELLSQTITEYQELVRQKEQQLTDIKRKRLSLKKDGRQKLQQIRTMMKRQKEKQESVDVTETEKLLDTLGRERQITAVIQNVFQTIIVGSRVNWAEDPSLKAIVLQLEKNAF